MSKTKTTKPTPKKPKPATVRDARGVPIRKGDAVVFLGTSLFATVATVGADTLTVHYDIAPDYALPWNPKHTAVLARAPRKGAK